MKLTRKHQAYLGVLGIGLLVLVGDQFMGGGDESGDAVASTDEFTIAPAEAPAAAPAPGKSDKSGPTIALAQRLRNLEEATGLEVTQTRDAMHPPATWMPAPAVTVALGAPPPPPDPGQLFARKHRLTAVVVSARGAYALIAGKFIFIGQELDGFRLVSVTKNSAVFQSKAARVELKLEQPEDADGAVSRAGAS